MSEKHFSHPRWNDLQIPDVVGKIERTEEQKKKHRENFLERLRAKGINTDGAKRYVSSEEQSSE